MPPSKPIPPQLLHMAGQGDVTSMRRLGVLLEPRNSTPDILNVIFNCLTAHPVPLINTPASRYILKNVVGARPGACLGALWSIVDSGGDMKPDVKEALIEHMFESGDCVFGWMRLCLQHEIHCVPDDRFKKKPASRMDIYLFQARMLLILRSCDERYAGVMLASRAHLDLFLELWLAEDHRDQSGGVYRMLDTTSMFPCETIQLADKILSNEQSKELFLSHFDSRRRCDEFSIALVDRLKRGWEHRKFSPVHFKQSVPP
ncbi:hypothetical protein NMY22_g11410 [Coprinellus aureogranulatus]|nr:hypothetical protein NMY22_g11410 [Coprinellus aureogranulatus]